MENRPRPLESSALRRSCAALLALGVLLSAAVRVDTAFRDPGFDTARPEGVLKSDPGLLYYFTERIVEAGGRPPGDFRADPRVQHPRLTDVPAEFTVGQEFLSAWLYLLLGRPLALHAFCAVVASLTASLAAIGVYGLVRWSTRSSPWALAAAGLALLLPGSYRTIGFVLVREDLAFPLFALHLALLARALRGTLPEDGRRAWRAFLLAGVPLALALATWHAMRFFVLLEGLLGLAWLLFRDENALARRGAWALLAPPVLLALLVPALRSGALLLAQALLLPAALLLAGLLGSRLAAGSHMARGRAGRAGIALGVWVVLSAVAALVPRGPSGYAHVRDVVVAKVRHLGRLPHDPAALTFDARLLWQGPFETLELGWGLQQLGTALPLLALACAVLLHRPSRRAAAGAGPLVLGALVSLPVAWLFARAVVLPALLVPAAAVALVARAAGFASLRPTALGLTGAALLVQLGLFVSFVAGHSIAWYVPAAHGRELATLVDWVDENLPADAAVAGDFVSSTAILAHTRRAVVLQPKYETDESRRRAEAFFTTLYRGTPAELSRLLRERFRCRWLLLDRHVLGWEVSRYAAGLRPGERPPPGSPVALLAGAEPPASGAVPGFELVYRSPAAPPGLPGDFHRLYRLTDDLPSSPETLSR